MDMERHSEERDNTPGLLMVNRVSVCSEQSPHSAIETHLSSDLLYHLTASHPQQLSHYKGKNRQDADTLYLPWRGLEGEDSRAGRLPEETE